MNIALIAHDKKKQQMIELCQKYEDVLAKHTLYATGTTGLMIMGATKLNIIRMKSGPLGGDQQIGSMVADGKLDMIIFLRDPLTAQPHTALRFPLKALYCTRHNPVFPASPGPSGNPQPPAALPPHWRTDTDTAQSGNTS